MPKLKNFRNLIVEIPIGRHSEEVKKEFWQDHFEIAKISPVYTNIFGANSIARISRGKIIAAPKGLEKCAMILLWGYTTGMRGNQHKNYLENLRNICGTCSSHPKSWDEFYSRAKQIGNLGISTITKLAYFHGFKFNNNPALILDQQIINTLQTEHWDELKDLSGIQYWNAHNAYVQYLERMKIVASDLKVKGAQLEFFLFGMGKLFD